MAKQEKKGTGTKRKPTKTGRTPRGREALRVLLVLCLIVLFVFGAAQNILAADDGDDDGTGKDSGLPKINEVCLTAFRDYKMVLLGPDGFFTTEGNLLRMELFVGKNDYFGLSAAPTMWTRPIKIFIGDNVSGNVTFMDPPWAVLEPSIFLPPGMSVTVDYGSGFGIHKSVGGSVDGEVTFVPSEDWFLRIPYHWVKGNNMGGIDASNDTDDAQSYRVMLYGLGGGTEGRVWFVPRTIPDWSSYSTIEEVQAAVSARGDAEKVAAAYVQGNSISGGAIDRPFFFWNSLPYEDFLGWGAKALSTMPIVEFPKRLNYTQTALNYILANPNECMLLGRCSSPAIGDMSSDFRALEQKLNDPQTTAGFFEWLRTQPEFMPLRLGALSSARLSGDGTVALHILPLLKYAYTTYLRLGWDTLSETERALAGYIIPLFLTGAYSYDNGMGSPFIWDKSMSAQRTLYNWNPGVMFTQGATAADKITVDGVTINALKLKEVDPGLADKNKYLATALAAQGASATAWVNSVMDNYNALAGGFNLTKWIADFLYDISSELYPRAMSLTRNIIQNGSVWIITELRKSGDVSFTVTTTDKGEAYELNQPHHSSVIKYIFNVMLALTFSLFSLIIMLLGVLIVKDAVMGGGSLQLKQYLPRIVFFAILIALSQYFFLFLLYINAALVNVWFDIPLFGTDLATEALPRMVGNSFGLSIWVFLLAIGVFLLAIVLWSIYIYRSAVLCVLFILTPVALLAGVLPSTQRYYNFWLWTSIETIFIQFLHTIIFCVFIGVWLAVHQGADGGGAIGVFSDYGDLDPSFWDIVSEELLLACILLLTITLPGRIFGSAIGARSIIGAMIGGQLIRGAMGGLGKLTGGLAHAPGGALKGATSGFKRSGGGKGTTSPGGGGPGGSGGGGPGGGGPSGGGPGGGGPSGGGPGGGGPSGGGPGGGGSSGGGPGGAQGSPESFDDSATTPYQPQQGAGEQSPLLIADGHGRVVGEHRPASPDATTDAAVATTAVAEGNATAQQVAEAGQQRGAAPRGGAGTPSRTRRAVGYGAGLPFKVVGGAITGATGKFPFGGAAVGRTVGNMFSGVPRVAGKVDNYVRNRNVASAKPPKRQ